MRTRRRVWTKELGDFSRLGERMLLSDSKQIYEIAPFNRTFRKNRSRAWRPSTLRFSQALSWSHSQWFSDVSPLTFPHEAIRDSAHRWKLFVSCCPRADPIFDDCSLDCSSLPILHQGLIALRWHQLVLSPTVATEFFSAVQRKAPNCQYSIHICLIQHRHWWLQKGANRRLLMKWNTC